MYGHLKQIAMGCPHRYRLGRMTFDQQSIQFRAGDRLRRHIHQKTSKETVPMLCHYRLVLLALVLACVSWVTPSYAQQSLQREVGNVAIAERLLIDDDPWGARDLLEREKLQRPGDPEVTRLLGEAYGKIAQRLLADRSPGQALVFAGKALEIKPDQVDLEYVRARSHEALEATGQAIDRYEATLRLDPDFRDAEERLVYLYKMRGRARLQRSEMEPAKADFTAVLRFAAQDATANYFLGYIALQQGAFEQARAYLDLAMADEQLERMSQMYRGMVEAENRNWSETVEWMRKARNEESLRPQTDPYLTTALYNLGVAALREEDYPRADGFFQDVLRLVPDHKDSLFNLAMTWDGKGDKHRARDYFERVRGLEPGYRQVDQALANLNHRLGVEYFERNALERAHERLRASVELDGSRGESQYYLGRIHRLWNEPDTALPYFETAIGRGAYVLDARFQAGEIHFEKRQWNAAIGFFDRVVQQNPTYKSDAITEYLRESWWRLALADVQSERWSAAEQKLRTVLRYPPESSETRYWLGVAALRQDHYDTAITELERAIEAAPAHGDTKTALSEALYLRGSGAFSSQRYRDAERDLERAWEVTPRDKDVMYLLGQTRFERRNFPGAIALLEPLSTGDSPHRDSRTHLANAYAEYGEALRIDGNAAQSAAQFRKAVAIDANHLMAVYGLGLLADEGRRHAEAVRLLEQVHDRAPNYRRTQALLANAHWQLGSQAHGREQWNQSREHLRRVVQLNPAHGEALYYLGDIAIRQENRAEAKTYFERAISRDSRLVESHYGLGTIHFDEQNFSRAIDHFDEVAKRDPNYSNVTGYLRRAVRNEADQLYRDGMHRASVPYYERFLRLEPRDLNVHLRLAEIAEESGNVNRAIEWYDKAIPLIANTGDADSIRFKVAMLAYRSNQYARSLEYLQDVRTPEARELQGLIHLAEGRSARHAGRLGLAREHLAQGLRVLPEHAGMLYESGLVHLAQEEYAEATANLESAMAQDSSLDRIHELTGQAFRGVAAKAFAEERYDAAERAYKASQRHDPSIEADYHLGVLAFQRDNLGEALTQFEVVEAQDSGYRDLQSYLNQTVCGHGKARFEEKDYERARPLLERCVAFNPADRDVQYRLALLFFEQQRYEDARRRFRDVVLNAASSFPDARGYLVDTLYALERSAFDEGNYAEAKRLADEIVEQTPAHFRALMTRARNLEQLGELADAERDLIQVLDNRPAYDDAIEALDRVREKRQAKREQLEAEQAPDSMQ